jgi:hypothetical protein
MQHPLHELELVGAVATRASGRAERLAPLAAIAPRAERSRAVTLAAVDGYMIFQHAVSLMELGILDESVDWVSCPIHDHRMLRQRRN